MKFTLLAGEPIGQSDALIIYVFEGEELGDYPSQIDSSLVDSIKAQVQDEEYKAGCGKLLNTGSCERVGLKKVLLAGLGKRDDLSRLILMRASATAARACRGMRAKSICIAFGDSLTSLISSYDIARSISLGAQLGIYEFTRLKTDDVKDNSIADICLLGFDEKSSAEAQSGLNRGELLGDSIAFARDMANEPSNVVTPSYLARIAAEISEEYALTCKILDRDQILEHGMGLLVAVSQGSAVEPRFIELTYNSPNAKKTVAIIGKGITFDTGGYSLKTSAGMEWMKDDMSGAAAVLGAMKAVGKIRPDVNVVALIPSTENCIGGKAIHPGDIVKSLSGKTVEINNTDAEGRLVLSDAVTYATRLGVDEIIDLATLTGACVVALGSGMSGIMGSDQPLVDSLIGCGEAIGDRLWQLPLCQDYRDQIKSDVADIKNSGGREAGAIVGALFINTFTEQTAWAHIDLSSATMEKDQPLSKRGCTAAGTGILIEYLLGS